mmetsp:Transcript_24950/g.36800  ORF Transcript_24950/g.36800 Transcript_24950/m.36800 type:complete len:113 (+) Transcript_24950:86-424(+)
MPERIDGLQCLNDSEDEWVLTLEGFVKFQLRRGAVAGAGYEPLKKNLSKILSRIEGVDSERHDSIFVASTEYMRDLMWGTEEYVTIAEDTRTRVLSNANSVFEEIMQTSKCK